MYCDCDIISNQLWCHQQNVNWLSETRGGWIKIIIFIVLWDLIYCVRNNMIYVLPWWTVHIQKKHKYPSHWCINSLAPGEFELNFRYLILQIISVTDGWGISCELALRWMSLDLSDDKSTLVQVMAWCHQATSHYLSQCWPRPLSPYGMTRPRWLNSSPLKSIYIPYENAMLH